MKTRKNQSVGSILRTLDEWGGFDNFNHWNTKEIATWIQGEFNCSRYLANKVALYLN